MIYDGVDTAGRITPVVARALKDEGVSFVGRYLVPQSYWKALTKEEAQDIRSAGLAILLCWEIGADDVKEGATLGAKHGAQARNLAEMMGVPSGTTIYFAADYDAPESDFGPIDAYLRAARLALGKYNAGLYGPEKVCRYVKTHCSFIWQCVAGTEQFISGAVRQYASQFDPRAKEMSAKVGIAVDLDAADTLTGMWMPDAPQEYEDEDGSIIYEFSAQAKRTQNETAPALKWARECGIITEDMTDCDRIAVILRRYHNTFIQPEDSKTTSGLISE